MHAIMEVIDVVARDIQRTLHAGDKYWIENRQSATSTILEFAVVGNYYPTHTDVETLLENPTHHNKIRGMLFDMHRRTFRIRYARDPVVAEKAATSSVADSLRKSAWSPDSTVRECVTEEDLANIKLCAEKVAASTATSLVPQFELSVANEQVTLHACKVKQYNCLLLNAHGVPFTFDTQRIELNVTIPRASEHCSKKRKTY